ncbi:hypothetical protein [Dysgonomonas sp. Marseille-P4361]|uniref:hypothetical protein n=1 Tax=Dysgonomonas sp. Marseille-P4361 TaxID=2161820 RepID=UPI000D54DE11|nr:hypothetical protein [Dysgonomonas sp. Marseille-P4361]
MAKHRVLVVLLINILAILLIVKALFFDPKSDTNGLFAIFVVVFTLLFDFYAVIINYMFDNTEKKKVYLEIAFFASLLFPVLGFVYLFYL